MLSRLIGPAVLILSTACGAAPRAPASPAPTAAPSRRPAVLLPSGAVYRVEVARTPEEQTQGLMFRESLPEKSGMIFLFGDNAPHGFWMKNTMIPLDIVWMDGSGRVLFVSANTPPCRADPCPTYGPLDPAANVLEIAGGTAAKEKVTVGSRIKIEGVQK